MNLDEVFAERSTLRISAIVDHLIRHFGIQPHARELALVLGDGTEACPGAALHRWVIAQCRELAGQYIEWPLRAIEHRLADHLEDHGYDLSGLELPSPAAQRVQTQLPNPDRKVAVARRLRAASIEPDASRRK